MGPPVVFLLGFLVLYGSLSAWAPVPGSATAGSFGWSLLLWPLPSWLAIGALRRLRRRLLWGDLGQPHPRWLLRASAIASPVVLLVVALPGGWIDLTWQWAAGSHLATLALLAVPLVAIELPRLVLATIAQAWLEGDAGPVGPVPGAGALPGFADLWPMIRLRLGWPLLLPMPCLLLGLVLDLLQFDRDVHEFFLGTSVGVTIGMLLLLAAFGAVLPFWFRVAFGIRRDLPEPTGALLRATAASLGFRPSRVTLLPTGGRAMNAMMVGPLPFGRILCLTDGLLRALDDDLLQGVVAHEIGHARMGHPGLLLVLTAIVPLLLMSMATWFDPTSTNAPLQALVVVLVAVFTWSLVRSLAHRFEHEADIASVQALGAGPCSRALLAVSALSVPVRHTWLGRLFTLHPEENVRCALMLRYESEPAFRERFHRSGRRMRRWVLGGLVVACAIAASAWWSDWRFERVLWRLNCGDVVGARELDARLGEVIPERWTRTWTLLRRELAAAHEIAAEAQDWTSAAPRFVEFGYQRGVEVLRAEGPAAARPWFALSAAAVEGDRQARVLHHLLWEFCRAADEGDTERLQQVRAVLQRRGVPAELQGVFAGQ